MLVPFPERVPGKQGEIPRPLGPKRRRSLRLGGLALGVLIPFIHSRIARSCWSRLIFARNGLPNL